MKASKAAKPQPPAEPALPAAWVGLDVAKLSFDAALYMPTLANQAPRSIGTLPTRSFKRTKKEIRQFIEWIQVEMQRCAPQEGLAGLTQVRAIMEATGRYSADLCEWLRKEKPELGPVQANPKATYNYMQSLRIRNSTDKLAACCLARYGYENKPAPDEPDRREIIELRELSRLRLALVDARIAARNRAAEMTKSRQCVKIQERAILDQSKAIKQVEDAIRSHISKHQDLNKAIRLLKSIPGVGLWTCVVVLAELGNLRRFKHSRQISSFVGLSSRNCDSGTSVHKRSHLCKTGSSRVRKVLYMAAMAAIQAKKGGMRAFYERVVANPPCNGRAKTKMTGICAVMRKLIVLIRSILISGKPFDPNYGKTTATNPQLGPESSQAATPAQEQAVSPAPHALNAGSGNHPVKEACQSLLAQQNCEHSSSEQPRQDQTDRDLCASAQADRGGARCPDRRQSLRSARKQSAPAKPGNKIEACA